MKSTQYALYEQYTFMNRKTVCFTCKHLKLNTLQGFALKYAVCVKCLNIVIKATYYKNTATVSGWLWHIYYGHEWLFKLKPLSAGIFRGQMPDGPPS